MWSVRLTDSQRDALRLLLDAQGELGPSLTGAREALDLARWDDLPEAQLPWGEVETAASTQGVSEADVIWDRCGRHEEPAVPPIRAKARRAKRKGKAAGGKQAA